MIVDFNSKKVNTKAVTKGIIGFIIPDYLLRVEPEFSSLKERGDWYRKLLNCNNTLCFQLMGDYESEACVIFDTERSEIDKNTKLDYLNEDNTFKCEVLKVLDMSAEFFIEALKIKNESNIYLNELN